MKPFRFSLQSVLRLREQEEERARENYARELAHLDQKPLAKPIETRLQLSPEQCSFSLPEVSETPKSRVTIMARANEHGFFLVIGHLRRTTDAGPNLTRRVP